MTERRTRGRARIAVVVPFSNTNLEPDMTMLCPPGVSVHFARAGGYDLGAIPDEHQMRRYSDAPFEEVVDSLLACRPDVLLYGCTSATLARGSEFDAEFRRRIEAHGAVPVVTAASAVIEALEDLGVERFAFSSPYVASLNDLAVSFIEACGFRCVGRADTSAPLGTTRSPRSRPRTWRRWPAKRTARGPRPSCLLHGHARGGGRARHRGDARKAGGDQQPGDDVRSPERIGVHRAGARWAGTFSPSAGFRIDAAARTRTTTRGRCPPSTGGRAETRGVSTPIRAAVAGLPAYPLAVQDVPGVERVIQLGQNELGVAPSPRAVEAAARATGALNRYPDVEHERLRRAIAEVHGLRPERILCGAGSMELMGWLAMTYCEPGVDVVVTRFGYRYFELQCAIAGATLRVAPEPRMHVDVDAVLDAVTDRTRLVYVVNPGNPTGTCTKGGDLSRLRSRLPDPAMLLVDTAYAEFATGGNSRPGSIWSMPGATSLFCERFPRPTAWRRSGSDGCMRRTRSSTPSPGCVRPTPSLRGPRGGRGRARRPGAPRPRWSARSRGFGRRCAVASGRSGSKRGRATATSFSCVSRTRADRRRGGVRAPEERRHHRAPGRRLRAHRLPARDRRVGAGDGGGIERTGTNRGAGGAGRRTAVAFDGVTFRTVVIAA